ncbi:MAG: PP2C family serine/threonine-protein phosphatase [Eubacteriales bacterium]
MIFFGKTDIGRKRASNQDSFSVGKIQSGELVAILCDGMGGANGGNIASAVSVDTFIEYIETALTAYASVGGKSRRRPGVNYPALLASAVESANEAVFKRTREDRSLAGMGTTLVAAIISGDNLYIANVGDSRLYIFENGSVKQITRDHSYVQYLVDIGRISQDEAAVSPYKNIITRAVGREEKIEADLFTISMNGKNHGENVADELYILMCSDGLTNFISQDKMSEIIFAAPSDEKTEQASIPAQSCTDKTENNSDADSDGEKYSDRANEAGEPHRSYNSEVEEKVGRLINEANAAGGGDNITAVLIKITR